MWVQAGSDITRDSQIRRFVHVECQKVQEPVAARPPSPETTTADGAASADLPHGLSDASLKDYKIEWSRYAKYARTLRAAVPGLDGPWDMQLLWKYLQQRSQTCKPTTIVQILTKLRHFGVLHGHVLANSKYDADPAQYGLIRKMKKQVTLDARAEATQAGVDYVHVDRCTPVGVRGVNLILSSFGITSRAAFERLSRKDRHHVVATLMQHTGGMRFGQFITRDYTVDAFVEDPHDGSFRLITDYTRNVGERHFAIEFSAAPRYACMWYEVQSVVGGGTRYTLTAATILRWHFELLRRDGEIRMFNPRKGVAPTREARQAWLREVLWRALPMDDKKARASVADVSPHSFRSGLAGDLHREGASLQTIGSICRWKSPIAIRIYAERPCMSMSRTSTKFRLMPVRA